MNTGPRCFLCGGRALEVTQRRLRYPTGAIRRFERVCGFCGVLSDEASDRDACRDHLEAAVAQPLFVADETAPYGMDAYTLRTAATRWGRASTPLGPEQRDALRAPHGEPAGAARLEEFETGAGPDVSLGVLCRAGEAQELARRLEPHLEWASEIILLADDVPRDPSAKATPQIRIERRPLAGDFSAQRNALQDLARSPWVLQLDADESLEPGVAQMLRPLAAMAERDGIVSIGLPRRNLVDGVLSDLHPDTQYRLNRRELRFSGRVHERPVRDWRRSFIALCGAIDHRLVRAHVETRSQTYDALSPGEGRLEEKAALLQPFAP